MISQFNSFYNPLNWLGLDDDVQLIVKNKDTKRYVPSAFKVAPDGLSD